MRTHIASLLYAMVVLAIAIALGLLSATTPLRWDWSSGQRGSLSPASREVLDALPGTVTVRAYARTDNGLRPLISEFIGRYQAHKHDLRLEFVNPDDDPGSARAEGISVDGELRVLHGGRSESLKRLTEQDLSSALARLARGNERVVGFVFGHGERRIDGRANHDLGTFAEALRAQGLRGVELNLAEAEVPTGVELLVLASPGGNWLAQERQRLLAHLESGGHLLWLREPSVDDGLDWLGAHLGMQRLDGQVVDAAGQAFGLGDPSFVALTRYPAHPALDGFVEVTLMPQVAAFGRAAAPGWEAVALLRSGDRSWSELSPVTGDIAYDAAAGEFPGPLDLGFALTRPRESGEQRVIVLGDGDFLSNSFLGNGGNRGLGLRLINWLVGDAQLVRIAPVSAPDRQLDLGPVASAWIAILSLLVVPLLIFVAGLLHWRWRRRA